MSWTYVVVGIVVALLLYLIYQFIYSQSGKLIHSIQPANTLMVIPATSLGASSSLNYTYSIWFNINDWSSTLGSYKPLLIRGNAATGANNWGVANTTAPTTIGDGNNTLGLFFDKNANNLLIQIAYSLSSPSYTYPGTSGLNAPYTNANGAPNQVYYPGGGTASALAQGAIGSGGGPGTVTTDSYCPVSTSQGGVTCWPGTSNIFNTRSNASPAVNTAGTSAALNRGIDTTIIQNIPVQQWCNVIVTINGSTVDVYLNGKLVQTTILPSYAAVSNDPLYVTPMGGFQGWVSYLQYWPKPIDPQTAWNIYSAGYGASSLANLFPSTSVTLSLTQNGQVSNSITF